MAILKCGSAYFCIGPILVFIGSVSLCAICFSIVLPHRATIGWQQRNCTVISNGSFDSNYCSCERHEKLDFNWCALRFPCLRIFVSYESEENRTVTSMLFRNWSDAFYRNCTLHDCTASEWNIRQSSSFNSKYGHQHRKFICYVDPGVSHAPPPGRASDAGHAPRAPTPATSAILHRTSGTVVLHSLLWPSLCLVVGAGIWIALCCGCWQIQPTPNDAYRIHAYGVTTRENILLQ